jgi:hypothetical protein
MGMTLVKSLHSGDPDVVQKHGPLQVPDIQDASLSLASAIQVKSDKSLLLISLHSSLLSRYLVHVWWPHALGRHVEFRIAVRMVLFLECLSPTTEARV